MDISILRLYHATQGYLACGNCYWLVCTVIHWEPDEDRLEAIASLSLPPNTPHTNQMRAGLKAVIQLSSSPYSPGFLKYLLPYLYHSLPQYICHRGTACLRANLSKILTSLLSKANWSLLSISAVADNCNSGSYSSLCSVWVSYRIIYV